MDRAIDIVERALELHGAPIYVRHEIVHNRFVVQSLRDKGAYGIQGLAAVFIEKIEGSYSGVMGLPIFETWSLLSKQLT